MNRLLILIAAMVACVALSRSASGQTARGRPLRNPLAASCFRAPEGSTLPEPKDLYSENGVLKVDLAYRSFREPSGKMRYCYVAQDGSQSPTLRLHPGDTLILRLQNEANGSSRPASMVAHSGMAEAKAQAGANGDALKQDPCAGASMLMTPDATNLHFHGLE